MRQARAEGTMAGECMRNSGPESGRKQVRNPVRNPVRNLVRNLVRNQEQPLARALATTIAGLLIALGVGACTSVSLEPSASRTNADTTLQTEVRRALKAYEDSQGGDAAAELVVRSVEPLEAQGDARLERWTVDRRGEPIRYKVMLTPVPTGGTRIQVEPAQD